jgi:hypothetical protein
MPATRKGVEFYAGDLKRLLDEILAIWKHQSWRGAMLWQSFDNFGTEKRWHLTNVMAYKSAGVELWYLL